MARDPMETSKPPSSHTRTASGPRARDASCSCLVGGHILDSSPGVGLTYVHAHFPTYPSLRQWVADESGSLFPRGAHSSLLKQQKGRGLSNPGSFSDFATRPNWPAAGLP